MAESRKIDRQFGGEARAGSSPRSLPARWAQLLVGFFLFGVAISLMIRSEMGLGPWDAFHVGLHLLTGMSVGVASIVAGIVILLATLLIGVRPGPGTLANMLVIGVFVDLLLPVVPTAGSWPLALLYFLGGVGISGLATGMYISTGLGEGPRDGMMIGLSQRTGWPVRRVRMGIELSVLALGWLMGGKIGLGTVIFTFAIGPSAQWGLQLFGLSATGRGVSPRRDLNDRRLLPPGTPGQLPARSVPHTATRDACGPLPRPSLAPRARLVHAAARHPRPR